MPNQDFRKRTEKMRINVGSRFDHEFADNQQNTKFCDVDDDEYNHDLCLDFQGHQTLRINKFIIHKNYKFGFHLGVMIDAR